MKSFAILRDIQYRIAKNPSVGIFASFLQRNLWLILLIIWVAGWIGYQTLTPWIASHVFHAAQHVSHIALPDDQCAIKIELPERILLDDLGIPTLNNFIAISSVQDPIPADCEVLFNILPSPPPVRLEDQDEGILASVFPLPQVPYTIFITPLSPGKGAEPSPLVVRIKVYSLASFAETTIWYPIEIETLKTALFRRLLGTLSNTFVSVLIPIGIALWQWLRAYREKRREYWKEQLQSIRDISEPEMGMQYLSLWKEIRKEKFETFFHKDLAYWQQVVKDGRPVTLESLRREARYILSMDTFSAWNSLINDWKKSRVGFDEHEIDTLKSLGAWLQETKNISPEDDAKLILKVFKILGIESKPVLGEILHKRYEQSQRKIFDLLGKTLVEKGNASGRLLWKEVSASWDISDIFSENIAPYELKGDCRLWPQEPKPVPLSSKIEETLSALSGENAAVWMNPFGPEKGELDPRLPTRPQNDKTPAERPYKLFFKSAPGWSEAISPFHTLFLAPPGSGRSSIIWMGRHQFRPWGEESTISVYLPLNGRAEKDVLLSRFHRGVFHSLLSALAEDPSWFLDMPEEVREDIAIFLLDSKKDLAHLLYALEQCIQSTKDWKSSIDKSLLRSVFARYALQIPHAKIPTSWQILHEAHAYVQPPSRRDNMSLSKIRVWVDIQQPGDAQKWLHLLLNWGELWDKAVVNAFLFTKGEKNISPLDGFQQDVSMDWNPSQMIELLDYRIKQTVMEDVMPDDILKEIKGLIQQEQIITPRQLVRKGNNLLRQYHGAEE